MKLYLMGYIAGGKFYLRSFPSHEAQTMFWNDLYAMGLKPQVLFWTTSDGDIDYGEYIMRLTGEVGKWKGEVNAEETK